MPKYWVKSNGYKRLFSFHYNFKQKFFRYDDNDNMENTKTTCQGNFWIRRTNRWLGLLFLVSAGLVLVLKCPLVTFWKPTKPIVLKTFLLLFYSFFVCLFVCVVIVSILWMKIVNDCLYVHAYTHTHTLPYPQNKEPNRGLF